MKIHKSIGSKERFLEMFQGVNKLQINEVAANTIQNGSQLIDKTFEEFATKVAQVKQTNTQVVGEDNFVEIVTADNDGNQITFTFKVNSQEGDQDGVFHVDNAVLTKFKVVSQNLNVDWDESMRFVQEFNTNHAGEIANVVAEYADFETETTAVDDNEIYEDAVRLIDKVPYKKSTETMQTNKAYADQKPTNPDLRVHATELDKFVSEMEDYVNNAGEEDEFALPDDNQQTGLPSDDDSRGIDPYDQAIANAQAGKNDWEISGKTLPKPKKSPTYMEKTGNKERAVPSWAADFMKEDTAVTDINADNLVNQNFNKLLSPDKKQELILNAAQEVDSRLGAEKALISKSDYVLMVKNLAINMFQNNSADMNEESDKNDYPEQMGKKFKTKKPDALKRKRKKPQSVVKISEEDTVDVEVGNELEGGLGDDASLSDFCPKQLALGLEVEMEHTDDPKVALEIAMDHLTENPEYYGNGEQNPDEMAQMHAQNDTGEETGEIETAETQDELETDELLGYKPHNVNDYSNEEFDYADAEREYSDKEGYDDNIDNKDNDIPENFWKEFQALVDEFGEHVVNYLFNNGLRGYYETVVKRNYNFDEVRRTLEMLKVPETNEKHPLANILDSDGTEVDLSKFNTGEKGRNLAEEEGYEEYQGDIGDRYQDGEGNQFTVSNKVKGGVDLRGQGGEKQIATSDIQFLKKLGEGKKSKKNIINEEELKTAKLVLKDRNFSTEMTKKEAVQILIKHNIR